MTTELWHYCCDHSAAGITKDGLLRPGSDGLVWVTDLHPPRREALGLTMNTIKCDRMVHEFKVADDSQILWWPYVRRMFIVLGRGDWVEGLEAAEGAEPQHWYVTEKRVPVIVP